MSDEPGDHPDTPTIPQDQTMSDDRNPDTELPNENIVHFNPWRDFNDAAPQVDAFGDEPDPEQIARFIDVVFGYCDGLIPVRSFIDKGQGFDGRPHNIWIEANAATPEKMATFATWAWREGAAVYVIPGTVAASGQAKAAEILRMQTVVVDLDTGDIAARRAHLERHLGAPTMVVESGGVTPEGQRKCHVWWKLSEPAEGDDIRRLCRLRGDIAAKVGGDMHFRSAHQPIRVAGSVYYKNNLKTQVQIVELNAALERDLDEFIEAVSDMPPAPGVSLQPEFGHPDKPAANDVLVTPVREGAQDDWSRFEGASAAIGHFIRMVHEGRMSKDEGWEGICGAEIEAAVIDQLRGVFRQPEIVVGTRRAAQAEHDDITEDEAREALLQLDPLWNELFPAEQARIAQLLVERVDVHEEGVDVRFRMNGIGALAREAARRAA
jgi:hypothetical protein